MLNRQQALAVLLAGAHQYNLDPKAVEGIAFNESGLRPRAIGDNGTSFGFFQMHQGGALPAGKGLQYAASRQGILDAERMMASAGASGKRGLAAVTAIARNFERPADPAAEIARAMGFYNGHGLVGNAGAMPNPNKVNARKMMGFPQNAPPGTLKMALMQANTQFATTGHIDPLLQQSVFQNGLTQQNQAQLGHQPAGQGFALQNGKLGHVLQAAKQQLGTPYLWGGETAGKGFDCSGLIQYAYAKAGIAIPRTTFDQIKHGAPVKWGSFRPGDLIFSNFEGPGAGPTHVVMYIGNGKVIAAPHTGANVQIEDVSVFRNNFVGARRILK